MTAKDPKPDFSVVSAVQEQVLKCFSFLVAEGAVAVVWQFVSLESV
jgi:hypothetical protein